MALTQTPPVFSVHYHWLDLNEFFPHFFAIYNRHLFVVVFIVVVLLFGQRPRRCPLFFCFGVVRCVAAFVAPAE